MFSAASLVEEETDSSHVLPFHDENIPSNLEIIPAGNKYENDAKISSTDEIVSESVPLEEPKPAAVGQVRESPPKGPKSIQFHSIDDHHLY